ncbi:MAG: hypothetical protein WBV39_11235 [Rudaea sp.]
MKFRSKSDAVRIARQVTSLRLSLDKTRSFEKTTGFVQNQFGQYWDATVVRQLIALYREMIVAAPDADEQSAAQYMLAGFLYDVLMLDEAAFECESMVKSYPAKAYAVEALLARVEARRGNMDRATLLANRVNQNQAASSFRVDALELQREYEKGESGRR